MTLDPSLLVTQLHRRIEYQPAHHAARPALDLRDKIVAFFTPDECEQLIELDDRLVVGWGLWDGGGGEAQPRRVHKRT
ncbi:MAG: hypothetical protein NZM04_09320 [Methylacidiphilales bacterium]|nr:hypothetical protein [Candidatus Methylacidiphilales bacterium]